ncbi:MAG: alpha/beta hydrolase [Brevundimonas sp.]|nr:MAG: alpha/beta hydrolase [Brevundimonas sp.]
MRPLNSCAKRPPMWLIIFAVLTACGVFGGVARAETPVIAAPAFASDRLSVEVVGQGADVILIPGFGSSREVWRGTADRLKATHRVHLVQLAGFAGEPWTHGDGAFVQPVVDELHRYIAENHLGSSAVVGHSMGALVGLMLAQQHPGDVGKLMSVDSLPFFSALYGPTATAETAAPFAAQAAAGILSTPDEAFRAGQARTAEGYSRDPATRAAMIEWTIASDRHAMASAIKDVMTTDARPGLSVMTVPVTALYAADANGGAPAAMAEAMWTREYATLPGVTLIRVDDSRHFIMADQPERFAELLGAFLAE